MKMNFAFIGDVMIGRSVNEILKQEQPRYPWGDTIPLLSSADCRICNLECAISDRGEPFPAAKEFHFCSDAKNIAVLNAAHINAVSLANNHALDFGNEALSDTLDVLEQNNICAAGAGMNAKAASRPCVTRCNGTTIGLIACTDNEPTCEARDNHPGIYYVPISTTDGRAKNLIASIENVAAELDMLIVSLHWGSNWGYTPEEGHVAFAHALIDAGVDIVFGHSPHVFRGVEYYKNKVILYSAGNFIDDYMVDERERNDESFIFMIETENDTITGVRLYPTVIERCQARRAKAPHDEMIAATMQRLCHTLGTDSAWRWDKDEPYLEIIAP